MGTKLTPIEKEWNNLLKKEDKFISARMKAKPPALNAKLDLHMYRLNSEIHLILLLIKPLRLYLKKGLLL